MTTRELRQLLEHVEDTREIVLREPDEAPDEEWRLDELRVVWSAARAEANLAYDAWGTRGGADAYAVYRAAEDRADAAEDALAAEAGAPARVTSVTQRSEHSTNMEAEPIK